MQHFDDYQTFTDSVAIYNPDQGIGYTTLGIVGEAGEYAEKIGEIASYCNKTYRNSEDEEFKHRKETLAELKAILAQAKEIGVKAEKLKKEIRGGEKRLPPLIIYSTDEREGLSKELGDLQWYVAQAAKSIKMTLSAIVSLNVSKLIRRKKKGVIHGSGDNR